MGCPTETYNSRPEFHLGLLVLVGKMMLVENTRFRRVLAHPLRQRLQPRKDPLSERAKTGLAHAYPNETSKRVWSWVKNKLGYGPQVVPFSHLREPIVGLSYS